MTRAAGSPGTCGRGFRSIRVPEKPPDAAQTRSEAARALPVPSTTRTDTTPTSPADEINAQEEAK